MCVCVSICVYIYVCMYLYLCVYTYVCLFIACMCSLFHLALGNEDGFNQSMRALVAWRGGLILTEGKIGVLSVSSLFLTRVGVYVGVCVCIRTHTHTAQMVYLDMSPGVGMRHLEGPENKCRHTYIRICVQSTDVYIYAQRRDEILD